VSKEQLTTFEKVKAIRRSLLTRVGESLSYESWSNDFRLTNIQNIHKTLKKWEE
jgi:predicted AAA+ superfamily ATPase